jgi:hypothetical protein
MTHRLDRIALGAPFAALGAYLGLAFGLLPGPSVSMVVLFLAIGPLAIFGVTSMRRHWQVQLADERCDLGALYLIIAFSLLTLMLCLQQALLLGREALPSGTAGDAAAMQRAALAVGNLLQLGVDVAFDIFYCLGMGLVSLALLGHRAVLARSVGLYGLFVGSGLLLLNLVYFPYPPAMRGSIDLGPATLLWWLGVIALDHLWSSKAPTAP